MESKKYIDRCTASILGGTIIGMCVMVGLQLTLAWTGPTQSPPNGNAPAPLNVSGTAQAKAGTLGATRFYDDDTNYYVDANLTSILNNVTASKLTDRDNGGYYLDPSATSNVVNISSNSVTSNNIASNNWASFNTGSVGWSLGAYGAGWAANAQPQNPNGSIYTNDVYSRAAGKWMSQMAGLKQNSCYQIGNFSGRDFTNYMCATGYYVAGIQFIGHADSESAYIFTCCQ